MPRTGPTPRVPGSAPAGFRVARDLPLGRHPLLTAFPGLHRLPTAARHEPDPVKRERLHKGTFVELVPQDMWMYVAPHEVPEIARGRWKPVVSPEQDCIVIGESHLRESPDLVLFMDIFHELRHIQQRHGGAELWDERYTYATRPTEVDAYRFVVAEARRLGVKDVVLRDYLKVEWIDRKEYHQLLDSMGVARA
jgi:hypothetical protein